MFFVPAEEASMLLDITVNRVELKTHKLFCRYPVLLSTKIAILITNISMATIWEMV